MRTVRFEVDTTDGIRILNVPLSDEVCAQIDEVVRQLTQSGRRITFDEVAAEALGIGLSMTHGVG